MHPVEQLLGLALHVEPGVLMGLGPRQCGDALHGRRPANVVVLDMDSSVILTYGDQGGTADNAISAAPAITRCSCSTSMAIWNGAPCDPVTSTVPVTGALSWSQS